SRVMNDIIDPEHYDNAKRLIQIRATYMEAEDLTRIGAYVDGSDPDIDVAKKLIGKIDSFLRQDIYQRVSFKESVDQLKPLFTDRIDQ
ncbi:hypothetical protein KA005_18875, partial [bacterium]|nr:hypothetical protein [bacterium]